MGSITTLSREELEKSSAQDMSSTIQTLKRLKTASSRMLVVADIFDKQGITAETPIATLIAALRAEKFVKDYGVMPDHEVRIKAAERLLGIIGVSTKDAPSDTPSFGGLELIVETADGAKVTVKTAAVNESETEVINVTPNNTGQDQPD